MSLLKGLNNITESERAGLKKLLLERIKELNKKKQDLSDKYRPSDALNNKIIEIDKLIKFNNYLFHWLENPTTHYLQ